MNASREGARARSAKSLVERRISEAVGHRVVAWSGSAPDNLNLKFRVVTEHYSRCGGTNDCLPLRTK